MSSLAILSIAVLLVLFVLVRVLVGDAEPGDDAGLAAALEVGLQISAGESLRGVEPEDRAVVLQALPDDQRPAKKKWIETDRMSFIAYFQRIICTSLASFSRMTKLDVMRALPSYDQTIDKSVQNCKSFFQK